MSSSHLNSSATGHLESPTVIGPGSRIRGDMVFDNPARILGEFEGSIASRSELHVGAGGSVRANLDGSTVIIDGNVEGDITARECLQLNAGARVTGDIAAATMVVVQGASFVGHCRVGPEAVASAGQTASDGRPRAAARITTGGAADLEATLAGLESRLAGLGKTRTTATASE